MLRDYMFAPGGTCWGPPDGARVRTSANLSMRSLRYCRGKKWPDDPQTPIDDGDIDWLYSQCKPK